MLLSKPIDSFFITTILDSGFRKKLRHLGLPTHSHNMYALAVRTALLNHTGRNLHAGNACLCLFLICFQLLDHFLRNMNPGHICIHISAHAHGLRDYDSKLNRLAELLCLFHKLNEFLRLINRLGLEILGTCGNLSLHLRKLYVHGIAAR